MLGGHLDDMEADWSKPIVSIRYAFFSLALDVIITMLMEFLNIFSVAWGLKLFSFLEESLERISQLPCSFEVETLYLWLGKQENASMVRFIDCYLSFPFS